MSSPDKITQQLQDQKTLLNGFSPESSLEDIQPLKERLEGKKVIGMGEATHSSKEFNQLRHRFFQFLVEELNYRIFAWEASFGDTLEINNYVVNGKGTAKEALNSVSSPNCKTEEVLSLIKWIREHNKQVSEQDKVKFYGFDMQNDIASYKKLRSKMEKVDSGFIEENNEILEFIEQGKMIYAEIDKEKETELKEFIEDLKKRVADRKEEYLKTFSEREYKILKQLVEILDQCGKFCLSVNKNGDLENLQPNEKSQNIRDRSMAENVSWMMEFQDEEKIFVWAHNAHIQKGERSENPGLNTFGSHLNQKYEKDYYAIGFDFGLGEFKYLDMEEPQPEWNGEGSFDEIHENTLAQELSGFEKPFFLDFSNISENELQEWISQEHRIHSTGTYFHLENIKDHYSKLNLPENFDAFIFLPEVTASKPLEV